MTYSMVFDTETTDLNKCFCYDVGYIIFADNTHEIIERKHFVIEQIWHNLPLFSTAYYTEKRPQYVTLMRRHDAIMSKWGYVMQEMIRDIRKYSITDAYAFNSDFDEKVFNFNCNWFKTNNPLDTVAIHDIWGYSSKFITNTNEYKIFCETYDRFTDTGNYHGNAETVYQFITNTPDFIEKHMGVFDSDIESEILFYCLDNGAKLATDYKVNRYLTRNILHSYKIIVNGAIIHEGDYVRKTIRNDEYRFTEQADNRLFLHLDVIHPTFSFNIL